MSIAISPTTRFRKNNGVLWEPPTNCVLWCPGQDDPQSAVLRDRSGSGNNGAITSALWKQNNQGLWYLDFDGGDDKVVSTVADFRSTDEVGTLAAWINLTDVSGQRTIFSTGDAATDDYVLEWDIDTNGYQQVHIKTGLSSIYVLQDQTADLSDGIWHFICVSSDGSNIIFFRDGAARATTTTFGTDGGEWFADITAEKRDHFALGVLKRNTEAGWYKGGITLFRVFSASLSVLVKAGIYNQERHLFGV